MGFEAPFFPKRRLLFQPSTMKDIFLQRYQDAPANKKYCGIGDFLKIWWGNNIHWIRIPLEARDIWRMIHVRGERKRNMRETTVNRVELTLQRSDAFTHKNRRCLACAADSGEN